MYNMVNGIEVPMTEEEILEFQAREAAHEAAMLAYNLVKYKDDRKKVYPTLEELLVALAEDKEGRPEALADVMARRAAVKLQYPKP